VSTIAGVVGNGEVILAADTQTTDDNGQTAHNARKLFERGQLVIGVAGDYKAAVTLPFMAAHKLKYESKPARFMSLTFPRLVSEFQDEYELVFGEFELLIGTKGMLFHYSSDNESVSPAWPYHAIGSGGSYALGALAATEPRAAARGRLREAVEIATRYDSQSGGEVELIVA